MGIRTQSLGNWSSAAGGKYTVNVLFSNACITLSRIQTHKSLIQWPLKAPFLRFRPAARRAHKVLCCHLLVERLITLLNLALSLVLPGLFGPLRILLHSSFPRVTSASAKPKCLVCLRTAEENSGTFRILSGQREQGRQIIKPVFSLGF